MPAIETQSSLAQPNIVEKSVLSPESTAWLNGEIDPQEYFRLSREQARLAFELGQLKSIET